VNVSTPRVLPNPAASVCPNNSNDVAEGPALSCVVPRRLKSLARNEAILGPAALSVVVYSVPVVSSKARLRAPASPVFNVADPTTVRVGISIAVIRPGVALVPR